MGFRPKSDGAAIVFFDSYSCKKKTVSPVLFTVFSQPACPSTIDPSREVV